MKDLTKEQLIDLVFNKCNEIAIKNSEKFEQHISDIVKDLTSDTISCRENVVNSGSYRLRAVAPFGV